MDTSGTQMGLTGKLKLAWRTKRICRRFFLVIFPDYGPFYLYLMYLSLLYSPVSKFIFTKSWNVLYTMFRTRGFLTKFTGTKSQLSLERDSIHSMVSWCPWLVYVPFVSPVVVTRSQLVDVPFLSRCVNQ